MTGTAQLRRALRDYLEEKGLAAVTAWSSEKRLRPGAAVSAVSLRGLESSAPGYQDYLGERYNEPAGVWEELYGKKMELTFGLDLTAETAEEVQRGLEVLGTALSEGGPAGMVPAGWSAGETVYQSESKRYFCPVQAAFRVWAVAAAREDGTFLDFEVRGENKA